MYGYVLALVYILSIKYSEHCVILNPIKINCLRMKRFVDLKKM